MGDYFDENDERTALGESLIRAAQRRNRAKQAVVEWTNAEGAAGRLVSNKYAPGWEEYDASEQALAALIDQCGAGSPEETPG